MCPITVGMHIQQPLVTASFRNEVARLLPGLEKDPANYWPIFGLIAYPWKRDGDTDQIVAGNAVLASLLGKQKDHEQKRLNGGDILRAFSRDVFPVVWTDINWDRVGGPMRMRRLASVGWPSEVAALVETERRVVGGHYVYLHDGRVFSPAAARDLRKVTRDEAAELAAQRGCAPTLRLFDYLNGLAPHRFTKLRARLPEAHALIDRLGRDVERQHDVLRAVEAQAQPFYAPAPRSARMFAINDSILACKREVRQLLTSDWHHADLRSCQLAVAARLWDVSEVEGYLRSGQDVWADLADWMGLPQGQASKAVVKPALYGIVYGQGREGRADYFQAALGDGRRRRRRFEGHPLVAALLARRKDAMSAVRRAGGAVDCFGRHVAVVDATVDPRRPRTNVPSILAMLAQAQETALLLPALELAEAERERSTKPAMVITMWLHDGFSVDVSDERAAGRWRNRLKAVVDQEAQKRGFATELTW